MSESHSYPKGQLEICKCTFHKYPKLKAFLKSRKRRRQHPNLSIIYSKVTEPWLHVLNKTGQRVRSEKIGHWETEDIDEILYRLIL